MMAIMLKHMYNCSFCYLITPQSNQQTREVKHAPGAVTESVEHWSHVQ